VLNSPSEVARSSSSVAAVIFSRQIKKERLSPIALTGLL
jgi:hypothetical protein